jgi:peroxiredoxin
VGRTIPPFSVSAVDSTTFHSADHQEQVLVVAFLGVECPLANLYAPTLAGLAKHYHGKSVAILAVNSNAQDTLEQARSQARANGLTFPVLKDAGNVVADLFGAEKTPEVFVLDAQRTVRYRGMLDDQYGYRERRSTPTKTYAIDAVDALLKSETVAVAETPVQGCHIGRVTKPSETAKTSYYHDVLPILQNRCQQCHRKGEIGPFALSDYEAVRDWGPTIREAVAERRMPPWPADHKIGKFTNDCSLTDREIASITQWVDEGCPPGDPGEKPPAKEFVSGWNIGKPDNVYSMHEKFHVPATGVVDYKTFAISPVFTKDTWVQAVECRVGNHSVVHHMLVLLDFPKDQSRSQDGLVKGFFAAGVPGATHCVFPDGYAKKIPKGARLKVQMHYTPNGTPADDQSKFGIVLAKGNSFREI